MSKTPSSREARQRWQQIADGSPDAVTTAWLRQVARRLVAEVFIDGGFTPASGRSRRSLEIVGYRNRVQSEVEIAVLEVGADYPSEKLAEALPIVADVPDDPKKLKKSIDNFRAKHRKLNTKK